MNGVGLIWLDVLLLVLCAVAFIIHAMELPRIFRTGRNPVASLLRAAGWLCFTGRFGQVLLENGDILIPLPSQLALLLLVVGDSMGTLSATMRRRDRPDETETQL